MKEVEKQNEAKLAKSEPSSSSSSSSSSGSDSPPPFKQAKCAPNSGSVSPTQPAKPVQSTTFVPRFPKSKGGICRRHSDRWHKTFNLACKPPVAKQAKRAPSSEPSDSD